VKNLSYEKMWNALFVMFSREAENRELDVQTRLLAATVLTAMARLEHDEDYEIK